MSDNARHLWSAVPSAPAGTVIDLHRRLRGPYTGAGTLMRHLVPDAMRLDEGLVARHAIELLSVAPELRGTIPADPQTLTTLAVPHERTRFYSRMRTLRMAHGLTEFVRDHLRASGTPGVLVLRNLAEADPTDQEWLEVMLRRLPAQLLTLYVEDVDPDRLPESTRLALDRYARSDAEPGEVLPVVEPSGTPMEQAVRYVRGDCLDDGLRAGYEAVAAARRAELHDRRAAELEAGDFSYRLGAVPFHRERGADPAGLGARRLREAMDYCIDHGFYDATVDLARRGLPLVTPEDDLELWWAFSSKMTTSLAALSRAEEAESVYDRARAVTSNASIHMQAAYATAMLYTRHHSADRLSDDKALGWINQAIAFATLLPDHKTRVFQTVFNKNGLALVENHRKLPERALALVTDGLAELERELEPGEQLLHRSVLRYNRAQVLAALRRIDEALLEYQQVIELDPYYPEYHFDVAGLYRQLGRMQEALDSYTLASTLSPPFPEVYYNRADTHSALGNVAEAIADFEYVIELEPSHLDAHINLAGLLYAEGDTERAAAVTEAGLAEHPSNALLLSQRARLLVDAGEPDRAEAVVRQVLSDDGDVHQAWALSGEIAFGREDFDRAAADFERAMRLDPDPATAFNLATVYQAMNRWSDALAVLETIATEVVDGADSADLDEALALCRAQLELVGSG